VKIVVKFYKEFYKMKILFPPILLVFQMTPKVYIVTGLFYGDEGKGTTVDFLTNTTNSKLVGNPR
jgi:hypothetical protein